MTTTAIFAELLIIGIQASVWVLLPIAAQTEFHFHDLNAVKDWANTLLVLGLAMAYTLGILVDRIADFLVGFFDKKYRRQIIGRILGNQDRQRWESMNPTQQWKEIQEHFYKIRFGVQGLDNGISAFIEYLRSRIRIARASAFNFFFITCAVEYSLLREPQLFGLSKAGSWLWLTPIFGIAVVTIAALSWIIMTKTYFRRLADVYRHYIQPA